MVNCAVRATRPHPEERARLRGSANASARARVSKDEDVRLSSPSCFETHRSARRLWKHLRSRVAAMLLSMRARVRGAFLESQAAARARRTNLRLHETTAGAIPLFPDCYLQ